MHNNAEVNSSSSFEFLCTFCCKKWLFWKLPKYVIWPFAERLDFALADWYQSVTLRVSSSFAQTENLLHW